MYFHFRGNVAFVHENLSSIVEQRKTGGKKIIKLLINGIISSHSTVNFKWRQMICSRIMKM